MPSSKPVQPLIVLYHKVTISVLVDSDVYLVIEFPVYDYTVACSRCDDEPTAVATTL
jgi:hypothetical protein